jgi:hypothetical protein
MANIIVKDLVENSNSGGFIKNLSEEEKLLQGGMNFRQILGNIPTFKPRKFCLVLIDNQLTEIFC